MLICFDLDDTLFDHGHSEEAGALHFGEVYGAQLAKFEGTFVEAWRRASAKHMAVFLRGDGSFQDQRRRRMRELWAAELSDQEADELFDVYLGAYETNWKLFDDVKACLDQLREHQLGVITNGAESQQVRKLETLGISAYFEVVLSADAAGVAKPQPAIFQQAQKLARAAPRHFYIGDNLTLDAEAAAHAGWCGIWLDREQRGLPTPLPHITSLRELPALIETLLRT